MLALVVRVRAHNTSSDLLALYSCARDLCEVLVTMQRRGRIQENSMSEQSALLFSTLNVIERRRLWCSVAHNTRGTLLRDKLWRVWELLAARHCACGRQAVVWCAPDDIHLQEDQPAAPDNAVQCWPLPGESVIDGPALCWGLAVLWCIMLLLLSFLLMVCLYKVGFFADVLIL